MGKGKTSVFCYSIWMIFKIRHSIEITQTETDSLGEC